MVLFSKVFPTIPYLTILFFLQATAATCIDTVGDGLSGGEQPQSAIAELINRKQFELRVNVDQLKILKKALVSLIGRENLLELQTVRELESHVSQTKFSESAVTQAIQILERDSNASQFTTLQLRTMMDEMYTWAWPADLAYVMMLKSHRGIPRIVDSIAKNTVTLSMVEYKLRETLAKAEAVQRDDAIDVSKIPNLEFANSMAREIDKKLLEVGKMLIDREALGEINFAAGRLIRAINHPIDTTKLNMALQHMRIVFNGDLFDNPFVEGRRHDELLSVKTADDVLLIAVLNIRNNPVLEELKKKKMAIGKVIDLLKYDQPKS